MATLERMRVVWTGSQVVGPAVSTFYFSDTNADPTAVFDFFDDIKAHIPAGVQITVPSSGDKINDATGALIGAWTVPAGNSLIGTGTGDFILGTGYRIRWETNGIRNNRHVRGSTFIVPTVASIFDPSGRLEAAVQGLITTACSVFLATTGGTLRVWSRPASGASGTSHEITTSFVSEQPSWLRSRRT